MAASLAFAPFRLDWRLRLELRRWRRAGRAARLWWRDDDAAGTGPELGRLLTAAKAAGVPLTLAVVPTGDMRRLALRLSRTPASVTAIQHGVDHRNRRSGPAAGEFPHDWSQLELEIALERGWSLMGGLPGSRRMYAPPWNDAHPSLEGALMACGYRGWSASGTLGPGYDAAPGSLPRADAHLDLLRWRGGARFRGAGRFGRTLRRELARRRQAGAWDAPIGLLTHHLVHDAAAWRFLDAFLAWSGGRPELAWTSLDALLGLAVEPAARVAA